MGRSSKFWPSTSSTSSVQSPAFGADTRALPVSPSARARCCVGALRRRVAPPRQSSFARTG